jgi:O-antigen ligase
MFILPLSILPSIFTALSFHLAFLGFFKLFSTMGLMIGAYIVSLDSKGRKILQVFLYLILLLYCMVGIYQMISPLSMPLYWTGEAQGKLLPFRVSSLMVNPNVWGAFCSILVVLLSSLILTGSKNKDNRSLCFLLVLFIANLVGSFSRGAWLSTIGGLLFSGLFIFLKKIECPGRMTFLKVIVGGMVPLAILLAPAVSSRLSTLSSPSEFGMAQRILLYRGVLAHITDNLPLGSGPGSFQSLFPKYRLISSQYVYEAHSDYLQFSAESGIAGLMGFILFVALALAYCIKTKEGKSSLHLFAFFITLAVGANAVTFFHYLFLIVPLLVIGVFLIGKLQFSFPLVQDFLDESKTIRNSGKLSYIRVFTGIICIVGFVFWSSILASEYFKSRAEEQAAEKPPMFLEALESIDRAIRIAPLRGDLFYVRGKMWLQIALLAPSEEHKSHGRANAMENFNRAIALNPASGRYRKSRAVLSVMADDYSKALKYINEALESDRCSVDFSFNKAIILERLGKIHEAISTLKESLSLGGRFVFIDKESYKPVVLMLVDLLKNSNSFREAMEIQKKYGELLI